MLIIDNICKYFGKIKAVDAVSLKFDKNEAVVLLGENGAGKSTLFKIVSGFSEPDSGELLFENENIKNGRMKYLQNIGYVPEISALYGEMTTLEFLEFSADLKRMSAEQKSEKIEKMLNLLELRNVAFQSLGTLSKGYKKRAELSAAMLSEPKILLLDEPTEGLDPVQKESMRQIIKNYAKNNLVIISTHALEDVDALAQRVLLMHKGKMVADTKFAKFKKTAPESLLASFKKITGE